MDVYWNTIVVVILMTLSFIAGSETEHYFWKEDVVQVTPDKTYDPDVGEVVCGRVYGKEKETDPHIEYGELVIEEWISDDRELVDPEFEITMVVSVFHLYNNYDSLNEVWQTYEGITPGEKQWGWSICEHQQEHNYAACDIYTVRPEYVIGDPAMDTIGHEVWHGVAGEFHE